MAVVSNPYHALGLRRNPFIGEEQVRQPRQCWIDRGWSQAPSIQAKHLVQVMGDRGFGKTSHLKHWQSQTGGPYCYYPPNWRRFNLPPMRKIAYWDEADRIPIPFLMMALAWAAMTKATIVMGTHADRSQIAALFGLSVTTINLPPLDEKSMLIWADHLIEAARLPDMTCSLSLSQDQAEEITAIAQGSWRTAADYLHIWAADVARSASRVTQSFPNQESDPCKR